jgi:uncharacterized membrane protein
MESKAVIQSVEAIVTALEIFGVAVISVSFFYAIVRRVLNLRQAREAAYELLKLQIGKALQLGLEFLVAADIIKTIIIQPTLEGIIVLGFLIMVRTFLSWSITVEIEGCWPWQVAKYRNGKGPIS